MSTPVVGSPRCCPVCRTTPLEGRQTVCSAACRRARGRQRSAAKLAARDKEIRAVLEAALTKLPEGGLMNVSPQPVAMSDPNALPKAFTEFGPGTNGLIVQPAPALVFKRVHPASATVHQWGPWSVATWVEWCGHQQEVALVPEGDGGFSEIQVLDVPS